MGLRLWTIGLLWSMVACTATQAQVQVGQYRLSRYQQILTEYRRDGTVFVRVSGDRVLLESTDGRLRMEARVITAESRLRTGQESRLTRARAEGQVTIRVHQPREKRTARGTAGVVTYDDTTRQVTLQGGVVVEVEDPQFVALQRGDRGTIFLGEQELRVVLEGDPDRTETVIQTRQPPSEGKK